MTESISSPDASGAPFPRRAAPDPGEWAAIGLLAACVIRIVGSLIAGLIEGSRNSEPFGEGKRQAGLVLLRVTSFVDGDAVLLLIVTIVLYLYVRTHPVWFRGRNLALFTTVLSALTALGSLLSIVGYALLRSGQPQIAADMTDDVGRGLAYVVVAIVAGVAAYRLTWSIDEQLATGADTGGREEQEQG